MRRFTNPFPRRFRRRKAQALTEFAIVAPVMVTCLLFAMYFYEIIQIKLKAQEVGRFAAWEYTSYPLHDYDTGKTSGHFNEARSGVDADIGTYYANLRSTDKKHAKKWFMVEWSPPTVMASDQLEPKIPGGSMVNQLFNFAGAPNRYGLPPYYELHVWAWRSNPRGPFADMNPKVSCAAARPGQ